MIILLQRLLPIVLLLLLTESGFGQTRLYDNWYFGNRAGLRFGSTPAAPITNGSLTTDEGSSSISHPVTGEILFYTNGETVWDRTHEIMENGTGLYGHISSTQSAIIVPMPGDSNQYFIFTASTPFTGPDGTEIWYGLRYSTVNLRQNGGRGAVVQKNVMLMPYCPEKLTAARHCNGRDFWVITHEIGNNAFRAYPITPSGVGAPVITRVGYNYDFFLDSSYAARSGIGNLKVSPDGRRIAAANTHVLHGDDYWASSVEVFDFDNATGLISNPIRVIYQTGGFYYGIAFSPDNSKLYATAYKERGEMYQWDLTAGSTLEIENSLTYIDLPVSAQLAGVQLGPDGRIYVSPVGRLFLSVIEKPNEPGTDCDFRFEGVPLGGRLSTYGLPNCIDGMLFAQSSVGHSNIIVTADTTVCAGTSVRLNASGASGFRWESHESLSCLDCPSPIATPSRTTTYRVMVSGGSACQVFDSVTIHVSEVSADAGPDLSICPGRSIALNASGGLSYRWSPADGLSCADCPNPVAAPDVTTTYVLTAINAEGCEGLDTVTVSVREGAEIIPLRVRRQQHDSINRPLMIPVEIEGTFASTDINVVDLVIEYDPEVMEVDESSIERLLAGTALEGWDVQIVERSIGRLVVRLIAPEGKTLSGKGHLLRFESMVYMEKIEGLKITVSTESECFVFALESEYADPISGVRYYVGEESGRVVAAPNPATDRVVFSFGLESNERTQLEIFDLLGERVGLVVDDRLEPGKHSVEWKVEGIAPGVYWYRLTNGERRDKGEIRIGR